jgi:hypothetical protein
VALVNNFSPDAGNANNGKRAAREIVPTLYSIAMSLLYFENVSLSESLVEWIAPTGYHALVGAHHVPINSVDYSTGHLGEYSGPSLLPLQASLLCSRSLHDQEQ